MLRTVFRPKGDKQDTKWIKFRLLAEHVERMGEAKNVHNIGEKKF
jgi:hypothetical protein